MKVDNYIGGDPVRNLWTKVIHTAWDALRTKSNYSQNRGKKLKGLTRRAAINFFRSPNSNLPWICKELGLDISGIRSKAEARIKEME
jgi:hypothetical protein